MGGEVLHKFTCQAQLASVRVLISGSGMQDIFYKFHKFRVLASFGEHHEGRIFHLWFVVFQWAG